MFAKSSSSMSSRMLIRIASSSTVTSMSVRSPGSAPTLVETSQIARESNSSRSVLYLGEVIEHHIAS